MRALRKHVLNYFGQLWVLTSDRQHEKDTTLQMTELKADWCRIQKLLGGSCALTHTLAPRPPGCEPM